MMRGLYVHIPFCARKCHYCDFVITVNRTDDFRARFFEGFRREAGQAFSRFGALAFDTLYLGGGTPSALSNTELSFAVDLLNRHFRFASGFEFTAEVNPEDISPEKLNHLKALGVNRLSFGLQSFDDGLLRDMGRLHTAEEGARAVRSAQEHGFENITIDLIDRLPGQTLDQWEATLNKAVSLKPKQISIYDLEVHDHTAFGAKAKTGRLVLPSEETHLKMAELTHSFLKQNEYVQYELLSFAKPGFESKHNLIYWHNQEYLGLGPGAFSYLNGIRYQFARDVAGYLQKCEQEDWANDVQDVLTEEEKEMETLLTGLRLQDGVSLSQFPLTRNRIEKELGPYLKEGLVQQGKDRISFTLRGRFVAENILSELTSVRTFS